MLIQHFLLKTTHILVVTSYGLVYLNAECLVSYYRSYKHSVDWEDVLNKEMVNNHKASGVAYFKLQYFS
jgi:hypothetical protein